MGGDCPRVLHRLMSLDSAAMQALFDFHTSLVQQRLPRLAAHFDQLSIQPQLYLVEWIFTLYAKVLPAEVTAWVWDQLFVGGEQILLGAAVGLLQLLEPVLLGMDETEIPRALKAVTETRQSSEASGELALEAFGDIALWKQFLDYATEAVADIRARKNVLKQETWFDFVSRVRGEKHRDTGSEPPTKGKETHL